ncbi:hypothetical protein B0F90DRAFT_1690760 [Multifurca ochricompacta]|uniref:Alpha-ketoglutarate-dependent dioxygenase AlkB-like domain-containing protein n=1 Tax=Multifurca ochricompacta TaxID=376703 RepID=A0AAD4MCF2_9AGAM|nr:hypothetical protein B0F90DRAFT_1690760 [Multifurca ochricompacta]
MQRIYRPVFRLNNSATQSYSTLPSLPSDFSWLPRFFDLSEQHSLLSAALRKLDEAEPRALRKRRRDFLASYQLDQNRDTGDLKNVFLPDEFYHFEEGHYDGVIKRFREMRLSNWDDEKDPILRSALGRLGTLYPSRGGIQTHLLHLASNGEIHPHIDNIGASGSWILGISLGSERVLRMESVEDDIRGMQKHTFDVLLPSGSVYIQK